MPCISFTLPGAPVGKGRPRFGNGRVFTPARTESYESMVKACAYEAMRGQELIPGAIKVSISAFFPIPKSMTKARKALAEDENLWVETKPDLDNIAKIILDPLNGIVYGDDSSVCYITIVKVYSPRPRVEVCIEDAYS